MSKVLTVSRYFPATYPRKGELTYFVEKIKKSLGILSLSEKFELGNNILDKCHTIRSGNRWKAGDMASLRYWTGKPYNSPQEEFAEVEIVNVIDIVFVPKDEFLSVDGINYVHGYDTILSQLAENDGLSKEDLIHWFGTKGVNGQIICWKEVIEY